MTVTIGIDQGLPGDQILAFGEDRAGSMWVGTANGLARLGGREPEVFHVAEGLPRAMIYSIVELAGRLLVGSGAGVAHFDRTSRSFVAEGPLSGRVEALAADEHQAVWALARNPPGLAALRGGQWQELTLPPAALSPVNLAIAGSTLWFADRHSGVWRGDVVGDSVTWRLVVEEPAFDVAILGPGRVVARTKAHVVLLDGAGAELERQLVPGEIGLLLRALARRPDGRLVVASDTGLFDWSPGHLLPLELPSALTFGSLLVFHFDRRGDLWLGTVERGAQVVRLASGIEVLEGDLDVSGLFDTPNHGSFALRRGEIYSVDLDAGADRLVASPIGAASQSGHWMGPPCEADGALLAPTTLGVQRIVGDPQRVEPDPRFLVLGAQLVTRVTCDRTGRVWASGHGGLAVLDPGGEGARLVGRRGGIGRYGYHAVDASGRVWVIEQGSLVWSLDPLSEEMTEHPSPCPRRVARWIVPAHDGGVLVGCDDGAWATLGRPGGELLGEARGPLGRLAVQSLLPFGDTGRFLGVVGERLVELTLDPPRLERVVADRSELAGVELPFVAAAFLPDGRVVLSSLRRVARLPVDRKPIEMGVLRLVSANANRAGDGGLDLPARPNRLMLAVELADPLAAARIRYRWRVAEGVWSSWQADATVVVANLPPGAHQLEVEALDRSGRLSRPLIVPVRVETNWYERGSLQLAGFGLLVLAVVLFVRWRVALIEADRRRLELAVISRTAELAEANQKLEQASLTDPLTGLRNRRFLEPVADTLEPTTSRSRERLLVVVADLDHFKQVNDRLGHGAGDLVLVQTARLLTESARASAVIARWGGEEFVVLERLGPGDDAILLVERLRAALESARGDVDIAVTASFGWCTTPLDGAGLIGWRTALALADVALYAAKSGGRNCCRGIRGRSEVWASLEPFEREQWRRRLVEDSQGALELGLIELVESA